MKAYEGDGKISRDIPAEFADDVEAARMELIEAAAEGEDELLEKYLEGGELTAEEIAARFEKGGSDGRLRAGVCHGRLGRNWTGAACWMRSIDLMPSPAESRTIVAQGKDGDEELKASR